MKLRFAVNFFPPHFLSAEEHLYYHKLLVGGCSTLSQSHSFREAVFQVRTGKVRAATAARTITPEIESASRELLKKLLGNKSVAIEYIRLDNIRSALDNLSMPFSCREIIAQFVQQECSEFASGVGAPPEEIQISLRGAQRLRRRYSRNQMRLHSLHFDHHDDLPGGARSVLTILGDVRTCFVDPAVVPYQRSDVLANKRRQKELLLQLKALKTEKNMTAYEGQIEEIRKQAAKISQTFGSFARALEEVAPHTALVINGSVLHLKGLNFGSARLTLVLDGHESFTR